MPAAKVQSSHFTVVTSFKSEYAPASFTEYESQRTGMRAVVVDRKGPKVYGYFTLATEIHDDSGAPHTLEHLCFMGSKSYKYKGILDKFATRAYSNTNAWTATDHTAYTLDTAGWEGFAQILPIYLEHVLLPTLTDSGCYTEVHHVDGSGNDAGVVYSEMQGVQNTQAELMELRARRILYPDGNGFRYETGGMMEHLRVLTAERIREFHREMYQPKNLSVIIIGEVDHENLLEILDKFEDGILSDVPAMDAPFKRPWADSKPTPPLEKTTVEVVEFPEEDESTGEILIGFFGPKWLETINVSANDTLLTYLAESSVSVLVNTLVEKEHLASAVYYQVDMRTDLVIWFTLSSVATEKLADVEKRFFEVLKEAAENPLDMEYMKTCIRRFKRQIKYATETSDGVFADPIIENHLFGLRDGTHLHESLENLETFDKLHDWEEHQWKDFMKRYLSEAYHVSILGKPSAKLNKTLKRAEKLRVKEQQERLGEEGMKKLAKKLEEAKAENDREVPKEILEGFKIPGTDSIHFFPTVTARSGLARKMGPLDNDAQKAVDADKSDLPLFIHFEQIPTNFVHVDLVFCTGPLDELIYRPLLGVYMMNFFNTPIMRDGKRVEFEDVVTELEQDTISYLISSGSNLGNSELMRIKFVVEPEKYETAIKWIKTMLFDSIFDAERLKASITKMLADIPDDKRSGNGMVNAVDSMIHFARESAYRARNTLVHAVYLKKLLRMLNEDASSVISMLEHIRSKLARFGNMRAFVIANVTKLEKPVSSWDSLVTGLDTSEPLAPLDSRREIISDAARHAGGLSYIVPMPPIDSSFLLLTSRGVDSYNHPQLPALMVAMAYLDAVEGPMWVAVRGTGLAYGTSFTRAVDTGLVGFRIYRSPDAFKAFAEARTVVRGFADGSRALERHALEGAISSIVVEFANEQATMVQAAVLGIANQIVRGIPRDWSEGMLRRVRAVGEEEIQAVLRDVLCPLFEPETANMAVTCATIMTDGLVKEFEGRGWKPAVRKLVEFQEDYGIGADEKDYEAEKASEEEDGKEDDENSDEGEEEDDDNDDDDDDGDVDQEDEKSK